MLLTEYVSLIEMRDGLLERGLLALRWRSSLHGEFEKSFGVLSNRVEALNSGRIAADGYNQRVQVIDD